MIPPHVILGAAITLVAIGVWWLLPGSNHFFRALGGLLTAIGFGLIGSQATWAGPWLGKSLLGLLSAATVVAAVATISCRSPVYCAIWFGMTLTGTAGLFLLAGAQFLAVATIVVYAGAILVTFLFVLMLSQPEGHTTYDRRSWESLISAVTGAVLLGILTASIGASFMHAPKLPAPFTRGVGGAGAAAAAEAKAESPVADLGVSHLGAELFTRYLVATEAAGTLLFVALVGAAAIVAHGRASMKRRSPFARPGETGRQEGAAHVS